MHDLNPATTTSTPAVVALLRLLSRAEQDPQCQLLITEVTWAVLPGGARIRGSYWPLTDPDENTASNLLQAARALLGGTLGDIGEHCDDEHTWFTLSTQIAGIPVLLRAAVPTVSIERQLRARIAELEARASEPAVAQ